MQIRPLANDPAAPADTAVGVRIIKKYPNRRLSSVS